jgi:dihydrofolate reductase
MATTRKIIVHIATSADRYIARPDGDVDWLNRPGAVGDYGMALFFRSIDTILWGRKTYEFALSMGGMEMYGSKVKHFAFSSHPPAIPAEGVEFVTDAIPTFSKQLRAGPGKDIWMMGGAGLIASFLDAGEIDEFMIHIIPVFIGEGIPLIQPRHRLVPLALKSSRRFADGVVRLHYVVVR